MKKLIVALFVALFVCLVPHAPLAHTVNPTSPARVQDGATAQAELEEAAKLSASVTGLYAAGKYKEALPLAERVLSLLEKVRGEEDPLVGNALNNLAVLYLELKDFKKARPILERVLARREKLTVATSPATASLLISYLCLTSAKGFSLRGKGLNLTERINAILLQDAVLAAGLSPPENLAELSRDIITKKPQPRYPAEAKSARLQGSVVMLVEADETGKVLNVEPVSCWGGQKPLADAAVEAMRGGRLKQISIDGKSIKLRAIAVYNFILQ
ncbi:MAG TPA: tetratricopeptide repeat protein [Pyrinomonadaceae bacterium]|jgi:TonB family protein|nr:tetratricopeptide repeat protein [Pyrinomonadaceae bacterium]